MNEMLKALTNKRPCRVGSWKPKDKSTQPRTSKLLTVLHEDVDFVESYVFDFNRFLALGKTGYSILNIFILKRLVCPRSKGLYINLEFLASNLLSYLIQILFLPFKLV